MTSGGVFPCVSCFSLKRSLRSSRHTAARPSYTYPHACVCVQVLFRGSTRDSSDGHNWGPGGAAGIWPGSSNAAPSMDRPASEVHWLRPRSPESPRIGCRLRPTRVADAPGLFFLSLLSATAPAAPPPQPVLLTAARVAFQMLSGLMVHPLCSDPLLGPTLRGMASIPTG